MKKSNRKGKKLVYSPDGHRHYILKTELTNYIESGYLLVDPYKKKSKIELLITKISKDALLDFYETKNNSATATAKYFNISKPELYTVMKIYNVHKSSSARAKKIKQGKLLKYGNENYNNSSKTKQTCLKKYGVDNQFKRKVVRDITKSTKVRQTAQKTYFNKTGRKVWNEGGKGLQKWVVGQGERKSATQRINKTFNTSKPEEQLYLKLVKQYGEVKRNYNEDKRYPYHCDFYVPSKDLFIELNNFPTHYIEPFDENNKNHLALLEQYKTAPRNWIEKQRVLIWAGTDVEKRKTAKENNLNYLMIYPTGEYIC